ncbi:hypothetical protein FACS1894201_00600 [Bacteroidia bacterium]|nr:hypothetical protein FACS1894201_00600 [Bacteroidia bacterium]
MLIGWCNNENHVSVIDNFSINSLVMSEILLNTHARSHKAPRAEYNKLFLNNNTTTTYFLYVSGFLIYCGCLH